MYSIYSKQNAVSNKNILPDRARVQVGTHHMIEISMYLFREVLTRVDKGLPAVFLSLVDTDHCK